MIKNVEKINQYRCLKYLEDNGFYDASALQTTLIDDDTVIVSDSTCQLMLKWDEVSKKVIETYL